MDHATRKQTEIAVYAAAFALEIVRLNYEGTPDREKARLADLAGDEARRAFRNLHPLPEQMDFEGLPRPCIAEDEVGDRFSVDADGGWRYVRVSGEERLRSARFNPSDPPTCGPFKVVE